MTTCHGPPPRPSGRQPSCSRRSSARAWSGRSRRCWRSRDELAEATKALSPCVGQRNSESRISSKDRRLDMKPPKAVEAARARRAPSVVGKPKHRELGSGAGRGMRHSPSGEWYSSVFTRVPCRKRPSMPGRRPVLSRFESSCAKYCASDCDGPVPRRADFLADGIQVFAVSLGEQDGDLVGGEEWAAEVMARAAAVPRRECRAFSFRSSNRSRCSWS